MHDAGGDEVSQIVSLEVQAVAEGSVLARAHLSSDGFVLLGFILGGLLPVHLGYDDRSVEVSVGALRFAYQFHETVHDFAHLGVFVYCINGSECLKPFIHVTVVEWWSVAFSLLLAGGDEEIVPSVSFV